jgi:hypothetical protein
LVEGIDYYYNEGGYMVLTAEYHLERGYCCGNGCFHCPFNYKEVPEPRKSYLISQREKNADKKI